MHQLDSWHPSQLFFNAPQPDLSLKGHVNFGLKRKASHGHEYSPPSSRSHPRKHSLTALVLRPKDTSCLGIKNVYLSPNALTSSTDGVDALLERSHILIFPLWSQEISSPWLGWTTTSLTGMGVKLTIDGGEGWPTRTSCIILSVQRRCPGSCMSVPVILKATRTYLRSQMQTD
jgi:hypothetical protein